MPNPIVRPVPAVAPTATIYRPTPVAPANTTGLVKPVAANPGLVLAVAKPGWPAPTSTAVLSVSEREPVRLPIKQQNVGQVVSSNIFGGPVTVGDPTVTTLIASPYTDKVVAPGPAIQEGEGWTDIFGQAHGAKLVSHVAGGRPNAMGVRTPLKGFGAIGAPLTGKIDLSKFASTVAPKKGMSGTTKAILAVGAVAAVGGAVWFMKRRKAQ